MVGAKPITSWFAPALALGIVLSSVPSFARNEQSRAPEEQLLRIEWRRQRAMVEADAVALATLFSNNLTYTHSTGTVQSKSELMEAIISGKIRYRSIESPQPRVRVYAASAIVTGRVDMELETDGRSFSARSRFTAVYVLEEGFWRLVAYQSTRRSPGERFD